LNAFPAEAADLKAMTEGVEFEPGGQDGSESDDVFAAELDDLVASATDDVVVRILAEGVFVASQFVAELHLPDDPAVYKEGEGAVDGGLGDSFSRLPQVHQQLFGLEMVGVIQDFAE